MKRGSTLILRGVIFLLGSAALALCVTFLWVSIRSEAVGNYRPVLLGMIVAAIPFFIALFHSWNLLNYIDKNTIFSEPSVHAFRYIKYCAIAISGLFFVGMPYIAYVAEKDDAPGVVAIGLVIVFASFVIATFAGVLQTLIQNAVDLKAENDLTV
jgi:hypothetical protein